MWPKDLSVWRSLGLVLAVAHTIELERCVANLLKYLCRKSPLMISSQDLSALRRRVSQRLGFSFDTLKSPEKTKTEIVAVMAVVGKIEVGDARFERSRTEPPAAARNTRSEPLEGPRGSVTAPLG